MSGFFPQDAPGFVIGRAHVQKYWSIQAMLLKPDQRILSGGVDMISDQHE